MIARAVIRSRQAGFSLMEALVAMAVLATAAVGLMGAVQTHTVRIADTSDRVVARWVAENHLAALRLGIGVSPGIVQMMGQNWRINEQRKTTSDPEIQRVDIRVGPAATPDKQRSTGGDSLVLLSGFIDRKAGSTRRAGGQ